MKPDSPGSNALSTIAVLVPAGLLIVGQLIAALVVCVAFIGIGLYVQHRSRWKRRTFKRLFGETH